MKKDNSPYHTSGLRFKAFSPYDILSIRRVPTS